MDSFKSPPVHDSTEDQDFPSATWQQPTPTGSIGWSSIPMSFVWLAKKPVGEKKPFHIHHGIMLMIKHYASYASKVHTYLEARK